MRRGIGRHAAVIAFVVVALAASLPAAAVGAQWSLRQLPPPAAGAGPWGPSLSGVACPSASLCVAVGGFNTLAVSRAPSGEAAQWHVVEPEYPVGPGKTCVEGEPHCFEPGGRLHAVSCASERFCVVASYEGFLYAATDPSGGAAAWAPVSINEPGGATHLTGVSCPAPNLCVAVAGGSEHSFGKVLTSTDPLSGRWELTQLDGGLDLRGVSCGAPSLCVAVARGGRLLTSTNPTGGPSAWRDAGAPGGAGDLEGVGCFATVLCAAGNLTGNVLTATEPAGGAGAWSETTAGRSVQITGVSCPAADRCLAVDNNGDVLATSDPTGGPASWSSENLVPFQPTADEEGQPPRNALFAASCATTAFCALVGSAGRIFTSTDPFAAPSDPPAGKQAPSRGPRRPRTIVVFAEHFWKAVATRRKHVRARFRFYSPTAVSGFECKRDRGRYRPCRSPLRYWAPRGEHVLRVRAIGPTGLRGPAASKSFNVRPPLGFK